MFGFTNSIGILTFLICFSMQSFGFTPLQENKQICDAVYGCDFFRYDMTVSEEIFPKVTKSIFGDGDSSEELYFLLKNHKPTSLDSDFIKISLEDLQQIDIPIHTGEQKVIFENDRKHFYISKREIPNSIEIQLSVNFKFVDEDGLVYLSDEPYFSTGTMPVDLENYCRNYLPCLLNRKLKVTTYKLELDGKSKIFIPDSFDELPWSIQVPIEGADRTGSKISGELYLKRRIGHTNNFYYRSIGYDYIHYAFASTLNYGTEHCSLDQFARVVALSPLIKQKIPYDEYTYDLEGVTLVKSNKNIINYNFGERHKGFSLRVKDIESAVKFHCQDGSVPTIECFKDRNYIPSNWVEVPFRTRMNPLGLSNCK